MVSDFVSNYNNKEIADLEQRIRALYSHACEEVMQDTDKQWKKIEEGIRDKYEEYQTGKITQQDYYAWVNGNKKLAKIKDQTAANIADRMVASADIASSYINGVTPNIFAENANREAYKLEKGLKGSVSFSLIDDDALQKIMTGNAVEFKAKWKDTFTDPPKIYNWTYSKVQDSVYIGMLKGESMKKVADRIQQVTGSDEATAIRNARTSVISASNQGKLATFERAAKMGIKVKKEWVSARDNRVRDSHAALNGMQVEWDKKFPNGLKCPCDPSGRPEEVYNCRCTMVRVPFDEENTTEYTEEEYQKWTKQKEDEGLLQSITSALTVRKTGETVTYKGEAVNILKTTNKQQAVIDQAITLFSSKEQRVLVDYGVKVKVADVDRAFYKNSDRTVYLPRNFEKGKGELTVIHEHAHALYYAMDLKNDARYNFVIKQGLPDIDDIIGEYHKQLSSGIKEPKLKSKKFVTKYQGRIYLPNNANDTTASLLREYFSVGYETYIDNPNELKNKDNLLYEFIENHVRG